jgi:omega-6 fatty acid desaturase (delta-12 desaturase)
MTSNTSSQAPLPSFKHRAGWKYHGGALLYSLVACVLGFAGLFSESWWINLLTVLLLAHGMVIAAYLIHECGHNTIFKENTDNARLGSWLTWLCGASYGTYEDIRYKHFRHHVDNDDVVWFDYEAFFQRNPLVYRITVWLERLYIPMHDLIMHFILVFSSFVIPQRRDQRGRNIGVIVLRGGCFLALCLWFPKVALLYAIAYMMMITVLRFMDSLQHDYDYHTNLFEGERSVRKGDLAWEQEHTFSNFISFRYPLCNWLVLNFCYHNAHHAKPTTPWFELPQVHHELFGDDPARVITLWPQLKIYHRYRAHRIFHDAPGLSAVEGEEFLRAAQRAQVTGGNAASFLTPF